MSIEKVSIKDNRSLPVSSSVALHDKTKEVAFSPDKYNRLYIETYGCQMNVSDSDIVASIALKEGYSLSRHVEDADVIFLNTCAIRENAELKIRRRLQTLSLLKRKKPYLIIGLLGCMAERLKKKLFEEENLVDIIAGPDSYRDITKLISIAGKAGKAANTFLSLEETYADISPVRRTGVTAFVSIMRGCDNMCSFCVVPFTRGRERSRSFESIMDEVRGLIKGGIKEITLLGQNVNSYYDKTSQCDFAGLLFRVSMIDSNVRIRFTTSNPQDISEELIDVIADRKNICNYLHLPVQSGSTDVLKRMNRQYSRDEYLDKVTMIRNKIPDIALSTDIICGFCSETDSHHEDTLSMLRSVRYDYIYSFIYSERPNTLAQRKYEDNVSLEVKNKRLQEVIDTQRKISLSLFQESIGHQYDVLIEGESKRSKDWWKGKADSNRMVVFPKTSQGETVGDILPVNINGATSATLLGELQKNLI